MEKSSNGRSKRMMDMKLCTLQDVFENVSQSVGFNIEFKFDDNRSYKEEELVRVIRAVLQSSVRARQRQAHHVLELSTRCNSIGQEATDLLSPIGRKWFAQYMMGVEGVIVDFVEEITSAVSGFRNKFIMPKEHLLLLEKRLLKRNKLPAQT
ncbi:hypothetical protein HAX54_045207 [Datura stramonium]|uniref:Uncharacterized protein n=1 Tax=Datura stramonium TaxID=4076 RepID=A0ABS8WFM3_DATST|nr:hypothetical protein [Datura stramonium]